MSAVIGPARRDGMQPRDRGSQRPHQLHAELLPGRQPIEQLVLIEPGHLEDPIHRRADAPECQSPAGFARHRHDAAIETRRGPLIEPQFRLAHRPAAIGGREVQVIVANGAFQLPGLASRQEDDRRVRFDLLDRLSTMRVRRCQELDDRRLVFDDHRDPTS